MPKESILVIDDRQDHIDFLTQVVLRPAGYEVTVIRDGETGIQRALADKPDLIISDLNVPRLSGLQILQRLHEAEAQVPVILVTFHGAEQAAVQAFRLGARDYIIKPYTAEQMLGVIDEALAERRLRRERDRLAEAVSQAHRVCERRLKELNTLSSIGKSVTALLDEDRLLTRIVEAAVYITGAEEGFLLLADEASGELYMRAARGLGEKYAREFRLKVDDSLAGQVLRTGKPVMITGRASGDPFKLKTGYLVKSLLHVPIKIGDAVVGVLSVDHMFEDRPFGNHELYLLSSLADYAAIALENARLRTRLAGQPEIAGNAPVFASVTPASGDVQQALETYRSGMDGRLRAGNELLSSLREQVAAIEGWLQDVAAQEETLTEAYGQVQVAALPAGPSTPASEDWPQKLVHILNNMVEGVVLIGTDDRVVVANQMAESMVGRALAGQFVEDVCDDPRWIKTYQIVKAASELEQGTPGSELFSATTRLSVGQRVLRASFRSDLPVDHAPNRMVVVLRDITVEREAQRARDSFIISVSQELRTPITSIVGYADLLLSEMVGSLQDPQHRFLQRIRTNAERIGVQLNNLLSMTDVDNRQLEVKAEAMDLTAAVYEAVEAVVPKLDAREQLLDVEIEPSLPLVDADPDAMYHVLTHLLQNARRCSPAGARIGLHARTVQEGEKVYAAVSVSDSGGGIAPGDHKRVFNRYYRSDSPEVKGLGDPEIALPVVKVLVEAHGGRIWMDSIQGQGSTFTLLLPVHEGLR